METCAAGGFYRMTDTGGRCMNTCSAKDNDWKVSADEKKKRGDVNLCTSRCEGTYIFVLNTEDND